MIELYAVKNLADEQTFTLDLSDPSAFPVRPAFADKSKYRPWSHHPQTNHAFISGMVGDIPGLRVSKSNKVDVVRAFVADYDSPKAWDDRANFMEQPETIRPNMIGKTFSGGVRAIWILKQPINVWDAKIFKELLARTAARLALSKPVGGFDRGAWLSPYTYYEIGSEWEVIKPEPLSAALTGKLLLDAIEAQKTPVDDSGLSFDDIAKEVDARWPGKWPGAFEIGSRGPRIWDESANDPTAAIVRPDGITYFSDGGGHKRWVDLFGRDWVQEHVEQNTGNIIHDFYFDGKNYYTPSECEDYNWDAKDQTRMIRHLKVSYNISNKPQPGEAASPMDRVLHAIETHKKVAGCLPLVYFPSKRVRMNGRWILNSSNKRPVAPAEGTYAWGEKFPFIARFIDQFFIDDFQKGLFLAWTGFMYRNAWEGHPHNGQNLFLVGPANKGKTLMSNRLIGGLMGGSQDAGDFLLSKDQFSGSLFEHGIWTVDDESASNDRNSKEKFSAALKKIAANPQLNIRAMYQQAQAIEWYGRVIVTANDDPESLRLLPSIEISNNDKMILIRCSPGGIQFPDNPVDLINQELPFFAAWLRDQDIPDEYRGTSRYGVIHYCDPTIFSEIKEQSSTTHISELVVSWAEYYFAQQRDKKDGDIEWHGNITDLLRALEQVFGDERKVLEGVTRHTLSKALSVAQSTGADWLRSGQRRWRSTNDPTVKPRHGVSICSPDYRYTGNAFDLEPRPPEEN